jgi:paraquat-inducible protein A
MSQTVLICRVCDLRQRIDSLPNGMVAACSRCGTLLRQAWSGSLDHTAAFSVAALLLYVPANIYPILRMELHGIYTESTLWNGCVRLLQDGQWLVAIIVFLASLLIPLLKLLGLFYLVITTRMHSVRARSARTLIHRIIEVIGPWAMLDVFLLAILVALVRLGRIANVTPGPGLLAFASVVVLTILASRSFEPHLIWEEEKGSA